MVSHAAAASSRLILSSRRSISAGGTKKDYEKELYALCGLYGSLEVARRPTVAIALLGAAKGDG